MTIGKVYLDLRKKKITDLKYASPFRRTLYQMPSSLPVFLSTEGGTHFEIEIPGKGLRSSPNLAELEAIVLAELFEMDTIANEVVWEEWLQVATAHTKFRDELGLTVKITPILRGVGSDGKAYMYLESNNVVVDFPLPKEIGIEDAESEKTGYRTGRPRDTGFAYVKATPENIAALEEIQLRIRELAFRLGSFLGQDSVAQSLTKVAGSGLLRLSSVP